jgi:hypothetical protein
MTIVGLIAMYRDDAARFRRYGDDRALMLERVVRDLEEVAAAEADAVLTLGEGARESGYSADHLGRLVREQAIPNAGRKGAPRIRRRDLPRRAPGVAVATRSAYDADADARSLASRREGRNGD